jgi:gliding motility-associated-like protein
MDFVGLDYFEYEVCDNGAPEMCSTAKVIIEVTPDDECQLLIPNGFSPDGDGIGDYFRIKCLYRFPDAQLQVYSRWGNLVFEKDHYGNSDYWTANDEWWDGRSNNKWAISNETLPSGTYVYILKLGNGDVMKGTVFIKAR